MAKSQVISVRLAQCDFDLMTALAEYRGTAISPFMRNCAFEWLDREIDVKNWLEAYEKYSETETKYSLYDLKKEGVV